MGLPDDPNKVRTVHFHVQRCPWLYVILCLWLCCIDPFSCSICLVIRWSQSQQRVGVFLFKWEIQHQMSRGSSCLTLAHGSLQIFSLTQELQRIGSGFMFKGNRSPHHRWQEIVGNILHILYPFQHYRRFCFTAHFVLTSPATPNKQQSWKRLELQTFMLRWLSKISFHPCTNKELPTCFYKIYFKLCSWWMENKKPTLCRNLDINSNHIINGSLHHYNCLHISIYSCYIFVSRFFNPCLSAFPYVKDIVIKRQQLVSKVWEQALDETVSACVNKYSACAR